MPSDFRHYLRVPIPGSQPAALLRFDAKTLAGEVVSQSVTGYGLVIPPECAAAFPLGRILLMELNDLLVKVQVVEAEQEDEERFRLGLERIAEVDVSALQTNRWSWLAALRSPRQALGGPGGPRDAAVGMLVAGCLLTCLLLPSFLAIFRTDGKYRATASKGWQITMPWEWEWTFRRPPQVTIPLPSDFSSALGEADGSSLAGDGATGPPGAAGGATTSGGSAGGPTTGPAAN